MTAGPRARALTQPAIFPFCFGEGKRFFFPLSPKEKKTSDRRHVLGEEGLVHNWMPHVCIVFFFFNRWSYKPETDLSSSVTLYNNNSTDLSLSEEHRRESPYASLDYSPLPASPSPTLHEHSITPASSITKTGSSSASLPLPASFVLVWNRELLSLSSLGPYSFNSHLCIFFLQRTWEHTWRSQKQRRYLMVAKTEGCVMEFHACRVGESRWR